MNLIWIQPIFGPKSGHLSIFSQYVLNISCWQHLIIRKVVPNISYVYLYCNKSIQLIIKKNQILLALFIFIHQRQIYFF